MNPAKSLIILVLGMTWFVPLSSHASHCRAQLEDCSVSCGPSTWEGRNEPNCINVCKARNGVSMAEQKICENDEQAVPTQEPGPSSAPRPTPSPTSEPKAATPLLPRDVRQIEPFMDYAVGKNIQEGQTLVLGAGQKAEVKFPDGSRAKIGENTAFRLKKTQLEEISLDLITGSISSFVEKALGRSYKVTTSDVTASVRGTKFLTTASATSSAVYVIDGEVEVSNRKGTKVVLVQGGQAVTVTRAGEMSTPFSHDVSDDPFSPQFYLAFSWAVMLVSVYASIAFVVSIARIILDRAKKGAVKKHVIVFLKHLGLAVALFVAVLIALTIVVVWFPDWTK